jgi:tetratricopeptide (TPR) repeat protein
MLFKVLKHNNSTQVRIDLALLGTIWSSYVLQGLISPDQLVLALIGYSSAGLIAGIYFKDAPTLKIDPFIVRSITGVSLIIVIVVSGTVLKVNAEVKKVLDGRIIGGKQILEVIDAWPEAKTTELIGIQEINKLDNCILANQISDRLIKYDDRSAPGWYMKAVCSSARGDFTEALKAVSKSVEFDPINPLYLVGKAKVEIAASRSEEAKSTVARIAKVDPTNPELEMLNVLILGLK